MARKAALKLQPSVEVDPNSADRLPPQDLDAERGVLGSMMVEEKAVLVALEELTAVDFYRGTHKTIFEAAKWLHEHGDSPDLVSVSSRLRDTLELEEVGGIEALNTLIGNVPTAANIKTYCRQVKTKAQLRALVVAGLEITRLGYESDESDPAINKAQSLLISLSESGDKGGFEHVSVSVRNELARLSQIRDGQLEIIGIPTPFIEINKATLGLQPGRVTILGGDPGQGKTMVAVQTILSGLKVNDNLGVAIFTLEMVAEQYAHKLISAFSGHDGYGLQRPSYHAQAVSPDGWKYVCDQANKLAGRRIWLDDGLPKFEQCRARLLRLAAKEKLDLVVIDYIQLVRTEAGGQSESSELAAIARQVLELAKQLSCHMFLVSQFKRPMVMGQKRPRPTIRDFKASGGLEEIASHALLLSREPHATVACLDLAKNKFGPELAVELTWDKSRGIYGGGHRFWRSKTEPETEQETASPGDPFATC